MNAIARASFDWLSALTASLRMTASFEVSFASCRSCGTPASAGRRPIDVTARRRTVSALVGRDRLQGVRNDGEAAALDEVIDCLRAHLFVRIADEAAQRRHGGGFARLSERARQRSPIVRILRRGQQSRDGGDAVCAAKGGQCARRLTPDPGVPMVGRDPIERSVGRGVPVIPDRAHGRLRHPSIVVIHRPVRGTGLSERRQEPDALAGVIESSQYTVRPPASIGQSSPTVRRRSTRPPISRARTTTLVPPSRGTGPFGGVICGRSSRSESITPVPETYTIPRP